MLRERKRKRETREGAGQRQGRRKEKGKEKGGKGNWRKGAPACTVDLFFTAPSVHRAAEEQQCLFTLSASGQPHEPHGCEV